MSDENQFHRSSDNSVLAFCVMAAGRCCQYRRKFHNNNSMATSDISHLKSGYNTMAINVNAVISTDTTTTANGFSGHFNPFLNSHFLAVERYATIAANSDNKRETPAPVMPKIGTSTTIPPTAIPPVTADITIWGCSMLLPRTTAIAGCATA